MQLLKSTELGRHSLLYLKEIGHGWFGKVRGLAGVGSGSQGAWESRASQGPGGVDAQALLVAGAAGAVPAHGAVGVTVALLPCRCFWGR